MREDLIKIKEISQRLLLLGLGIFLALAAVEMVLRAGIVKNKFHDRGQIAGEKSHPRAKLLILGDSFINNWHTPDCLYQLLLKDLEPRRVQVLNAAGGGMGPGDYLNQMRTYAPRFRPDVVLLSYYAGNDLTNVQYRVPAKNRLKKFLKPFFLKLYLYHYYEELSERLAPQAHPYPAMEKSGIPAEAIDLAKQQKINPGFLELSLAGKNYVLDNVLMESQENLRAWEKIKGTLGEIDRLSKELNARLFIVIFPHTTQVNRSHFGFYRKLRFEMDARTLSSERPQDLVKEFCRKKAVPCLDLLPYFKKERGREFYRADDDHLNSNGNALAERLILDFIRDSGRL